MQVALDKDICQTLLMEKEIKPLTTFNVFVVVVF